MLLLIAAIAFFYAIRHFDSAGEAGRVVVAMAIGFGSLLLFLALSSGV